MQGPRPLHDALWHYACGFDALALIGRFQAAGQVPEPGIVRNFLGTRIEPQVHPQVLIPAAGTVEGLPLPGNWHADIAEWAAALLTVERAAARGAGTYRIVELGCGWGCWMTNMGVAARARGLKVDLIGIEAEAQHLAHAQRTLALNGFGAGDYALTHGVAGPVPGQAIFPRAAPGQAGWGGAAVFGATAAQLAEARGRADRQVLDCVTLGQLSQGQPIDLLHIDIQGAEAEFVAGNLDQMTAHVRHVLIGTHSRVIEGALIDRLGAAGWRIEMERPAVMPFRGGAPSLEIDGVQLWTGPLAG